jgi:hypothetical protein
LESHDGAEPSTAQRKMFRAIRITLPIIGEDRRQMVLAALRPLSTSPLFPDDFIEQEHGGSWQTVKRIMTTEIHLPWRRPASEDASFPALSAGPKTDPSQEELARMSLLQKLKQDVSVRSIGAVLTHEIRLFSREEEDQRARMDSARAEDGVPLSVADPSAPGAQESAPAPEGFADAEEIEEAVEVDQVEDFEEEDTEDMPTA